MRLLGLRQQGSIRIAGWSVAILLIIGLVAYLVESIRTISIPRRMLLCQLHEGMQTQTFVCPKGDHFDLIIGVPMDKKLPVQIAGNLLIGIDSNSGPSLRFSTEYSTRGNWLQTKHLDAYIINWPTTSAPVRLDKMLIGGKPAHISVELIAPVEGSASLWLNYLAK
jgi:hypothetical protein